MTVNPIIREPESKVPTECPHCARGWVLDQVETTLGEYEECSYLCPVCKGDYKERA